LAESFSLTRLKRGISTNPAVLYISKTHNLNDLAYCYRRSFAFFYVNRQVRCHWIKREAEHSLVQPNQQPLTGEGEQKQTTEKEQPTARRGSSTATENQKGKQTSQATKGNKRGRAGDGRLQAGDDEATAKHCFQKLRTPAPRGRDLEGLDREARIKQCSAAIAQVDRARPPDCQLVKIDFLFGK
jgi:hypothetical protein